MKMCVNGCNEPVHKPSKVLCKRCLDELDKKMKAIFKRMNDRANSSSQKG